MTVKVFGIAINGTHDNGFEEAKITKDKKYPIVKITYPSYMREGMVTIIDDKHNLTRISKNFFKFYTE